LKRTPRRLALLEAHRFQPTQNPFRDWNMVKDPHSPGFSSFNQPKTLSGIETAELQMKLGIQLEFQPTQNPFRDWNLQNLNGMTDAELVSTNPKPFQGLKRFKIRMLIAYNLRFNQPKTLSGIETCRMYLRPLKIHGFQPTQNPFRDWNTKSLLSRKVDRTIGNGVGVSTNPKPFQGLKHKVLVEQCPSPVFQPTQNPFRDWNG